MADEVQIEVITNFLECFEATSGQKIVGVPLIHGRLTRALFDPLLDRFDKRLEGWKCKHETPHAGRKNCTANEHP
nr:reverse transcriptase [Ipomoea batatas]